MKRIWVIAILVAGCMSNAPRPGARATSWIAPQRALEPAEWLAYDVSGAGAVGLGEVIGVRDTVLATSPDGSGMSSRTVRVRVREWLKVPDDSSQARSLPPADGEFEVGVSPFDEEPLSHGHLTDLPSTSHIVLFMLRHTASGWGLQEGGDPEGAGIRVIADGEQAVIEKSLRDCVAMQTVDAMLGVADLVLVGRLVDSQPCASDGRERCFVVEMDELLKAPDGFSRNSNGPTRIVVENPLWDLPEQPCLYVLHQTASGRYERVGYHRGSQLIVNGVATDWAITPATVTRRLAGTRPVNGGRGGAR